ncbi:MAG: hypothetical protein JWP16_764 [Alphaproteobacteria bacterium]|nr:hypothetical protein [Alphaproteobacteria bacterium]
MKRVALIVMSFLALPAAAQSVRDEVMSGAERCAGIADDHGWLDCFYGSAQPMRGRLGLAPAPQAQVRLVPPPGASYAAAPVRRTAAAPAPKEKGFFGELLGSTGPVARDMPLTAYSFGRDGRFTVTLQNGMAFVQKESDLVHAEWHGPPGALLATVNSSGEDFTLKVRSEPGVVYRVSRK